MLHVTRRQFVLLVGAGACGLVGAACSSTTQSAASTSAAGAPSTSVAAANPASYTPKPLSPAVKVKVGGFGFVAEVGTFAAIDKGYFAAEGMDIEQVPLTGGVDVVAPLVTDQL